MKINGNFVLREVAGEWLAIPVGESALKIGGMIVLNPVSRVIWQTLSQEADMEAVVQAITDSFDVSREEAWQDAAAFLEQMRTEGLLTE